MSSEEEWVSENDGVKSPEAIQKRQHPHSPLCLSDLNSSYNEPSQSLSEIVSTKHDLQAQVEAGQHASKQYKEREKELEDQINALNQKSNKALQLLDDRKERLTEENDQLHEELQNLPPVEFLQQQLNLLEQLDDLYVEVPVIMDTEQLEAMGILKHGETLTVLPYRIGSLMKEYEELKQAYTAAQNSPEMTLRKRIDSLKHMHKAVNTETENEIRRMEAEVAALKNELDKMNGSAFSTPQPRRTRFSYL